MREQCVNLCELDWPAMGARMDGGLEALIGLIVREAAFDGCDRLYIGSSFCAEAFGRSLGRKALDALGHACAGLGVPCTLTVPAATQCELSAVKRSLEEALEACSAIDEVTVNDYGMLSWMADRSAMRLNIGRLFSRDLRDPRYEGGFAGCYRPALVPEALQLIMDDCASVRGIEFDPAGLVVDVSAVPDDVTAALHLPYLYVTTGKHCSAAPARTDGLPPTSGDACSQECCRSMNTHLLFTCCAADADGAEGGEGAPLYYLKRGKTVYLLNDGVRVCAQRPYRAVYTPRHFGWLLNGVCA